METIFKLDHIMIETNDPLGMANIVSEHFGLPLAWPLMVKEEYTSIGVNFGSLNFEFIDFRTRFGVRSRSFTGLSGLAFNIDGTEEEAINKLTDSGLETCIGEKAEAHTTITVQEEQVFPTIFLVKYHFDTTGWHARLRHEFDVCKGGKYQIKKLDSFVVGAKLPLAIKNDFELVDEPNQKNLSKIIFETHTENNEPRVISGLIKNLDIILN